jgi:hypothetical protein
MRRSEPESGDYDGKVTRMFSLERLVDAPMHVSRITCEAKTWHKWKNHRTGGLIVFLGVCPYGSAGADDARYIDWLLSEFYQLHRPDGLVIDCRELEYTWGDDLDFPRPEFLSAESFPLLVVLRPEQQEAYAYAVAREDHRLDLHAALSDVDEALRVMKPTDAAPPVSLGRFYIVEPRPEFAERLRTHADAQAGGILTAPKLLQQDELVGDARWGETEYLLRVKLLFLAGLRFLEPLSDDAAFAAILGSPEISVTLFDRWWTIRRWNEMSHVDECLADLVRALDSVPLTGNTVVDECLAELKSTGV